MKQEISFRPLCIVLEFCAWCMSDEAWISDIKADFIFDYRTDCGVVRDSSNYQYLENGAMIVRLLKQER